MKFQVKFSYIVILILVIVILLQRSCNDIRPNKDVEIKTDTVYKHINDTIIKKVNIVKKEYVYIDKPQYKPGETIDTCKARFNDLLKEHLTMNIYSDTIKIDSIGRLIIKDTVWTNKLHGQRKIFADYKIPTITKTVTKFEEPKRQLYIGGNILGNTNSLQSITPGILYKNKKDQIYQANIGIGNNGDIIYGLGLYWKIKIR